MSLAWLGFLSALVFSLRTRNGKAAIMIALAGVAWVYLHASRFG